MPHVKRDSPGVQQQFQPHVLTDANNVGASGTQTQVHHKKIHPSTTEEQPLPKQILMPKIKCGLNSGQQPASGIDNIANLKKTQETQELG